MRWLVTRPDPDGQALVERLSQLGHEGILCPVLQVRPISVDPVRWADFGAVVFTSRNGVANGGPYPPQAIGMPVYAVGEATAEAAKSAGFEHVHSANGNSDNLADLLMTRRVAEKTPLVHICGKKTANDLGVALDACGIVIKKHIVYEMQPVGSLSVRALEGLKSGTVDGAIILSPATAAEFVQLASNAAFTPFAKKFRFVVISKVAAEPLKRIGGEVQVAGTPDLEAVLALLR